MQIELEKLKKQIMTLSSLVEERVEKAVKSLYKRDLNLSKEVINSDELIDMKEIEVEEECLKILALHQPVAGDLRFVIAALKINNDLERIGDLAVNIAERSLFLSQEKPIEMPFDFDSMEKKTRAMLKKSLDSLMKLDSSLAYEVCQDDDEVDAINRKMYEQVSKGVQKNPHDIDLLIHCLSISRHLERIADYATNISEDVIYLIEGKIIRHKPEKYQRKPPLFSK